MVESEASKEFESLAFIIRKRIEEWDDMLETDGIILGKSKEVPVVRRNPHTLLSSDFFAESIEQQIGLITKALEELKKLKEGQYIVVNYDSRKRDQRLNPHLTVSERVSGKIEEKILPAMWVVTISTPKTIESPGGEVVATRQETRLWFSEGSKPEIIEEIYTANRALEDHTRPATIEDLRYFEAILENPPIS